jgi:hypothetical protein
MFRLFCLIGVIYVAIQDNNQSCWAATGDFRPFKVTHDLTTDTFSLEYMGITDEILLDFFNENQETLYKNVSL